MSAKTAIFTIVSANYIAFAATLMQSVRHFHPDAARYIILSDALHDFGDLDLAAEIVGCEDLGIDMLANMQLWYSVIEFNTAVKPFTFRHLFEVRGFDQAIYLDPDIQLYAPLVEVFTGLEDHSLVLTPHMTSPLQDGKNPSDLSIMKAGVYNLGFAAIRNDADGCRLVSWWCDRLFAHCRVDIAANLFTDQRWMDLAPAFVPRTLLLRHHSYNVAYWNIAHRAVTQSDDGMWLVDGLPLVFYHFSGIKPEDPTVFSKHQDRFTIATLGPVARLCDGYRARVLANGWLTYNKIPYAYNKFADGRPILDSMRRWVLEALDAGTLEYNKPLRLESGFFEAPDDHVFANDGRLTRFTYQFWRDRSDLQGAFDLRSADGFTGFVEWFCGGSAEREGVPANQVHAARKLRDAPLRAKAAALRPVAPPWRPLSSDAWSGPARDAVDWLRGEVDLVAGGVRMRLQRQAALLWELRIDLQHHFKLGSREEVEDYQSWAMTEGMKQGAIKADLFPQDFLVWFDSPSSITRLYDGMPISQGMALTRRCALAREGMEVWGRFPLDERARLEQAFWLAFVAPPLFGWPAEMTASIRAYFDEPSDVSLGAYRFSRGMVAPHAIRTDVQMHFDLGEDAGRQTYLHWLMGQGAREFGINPTDLCPGLTAFMSGSSDTYPGLSRWAEFAHGQREDLRSAFDLTDAADRAGMEKWERADLVPWLDSMDLFDVLVPPLASTPTLPVHRCFVVISGGWSTISGLGQNMRDVVAALDAIGFADYLIVDLPARRVLTPNGDTLPPATPIEAEWNVICHNADTAMNDWNTLRSLRVDARRIAGHWFWELERIPARWIHAFSFVDEVWAASRFVMSVFEVENRRPVNLLPSAVTTPKGLQTVSREALGLRQDATVFLFMFDFSSFVARKNPEGVIAAFSQAFPRGTETVQLVIKTQNAEADAERWRDLATMTGDKRVILKNARLSREELMSLVATSDAFVSLHRSEGFGRGPAEAMLHGMPVIVTGYSGTVDFTDPSCACMVGFTMVPVGEGDYPGVEGQLWAEPDVADAARWMRWVHDEPAAARQLGERGREHAAELFSLDRMSANLLALLKHRTDIATVPTELPAVVSPKRARSKGRAPRA